MAALEAKHLVKTFGDKKAVDDASFSVPEGSPFMVSELHLRAPSQGVSPSYLRGRRTAHCRGSVPDQSRRLTLA